ncbi:MAG: class I SAM-dependent methyltransferase [Candidatus Hydrogenedentota bacterium]
MFDKLASSDVLYHYPQESLDKLNALVPNKGCLLELGGGGIIGQAMDGSPIIGLDISPYRVKLSNNRALHATVGDAINALPFKNDAFDTVSCIDVLHHLDQRWNSIFAELHRVLKPGGILCIVEPDARNPFIRWTQAPGSPIPVTPWHNEPAIDPDEIIPQLEKRNCAFECAHITIEGHQTERSTFPLWQRLLKAPFVILAAWYYRKLPNKFSIIATKPPNDKSSASP